MKRFTLTALLITVLVLGIGCAAARAPDALPTMNSSTLPGAAAPPVSASEAEDGVAQRKAQNGAGGDTDPSQAQGDLRMIVYTGAMSLQVNDTASTVTQIQNILASVNGYVASKSLVEYGQDKLRGTISVRIPSASLEPTLAQIRALGVKVLKESQNSDDVTAEFTDLEARRKNLEAYEVELQKLLETVRERTGKAEDILAVYNQLTQVRGEIEQIKGRQNYLQNTSTLATYTIDLVPVEQVVVEGDPGWNPGNTARVALDNLVATLQGLGDVAITVALFVLPVLLIVVLPLVGIVWLVRMFLKRRAPKKTVAAS